MLTLTESGRKITELEVLDGRGPRELNHYRKDGVRAIQAGGLWAAILVLKNECALDSDLAFVAHHPGMTEAPPEHEIFISTPEGMAIQFDWNTSWCDIYHTPDNVCGFLMSDHILYSRTSDVQTALFLPKGTSLIEAHSRRDKIHPRWNDTPAEFEMYISLLKSEQHRARLLDK